MQTVILNNAFYREGEEALRMCLWNKGDGDCPPNWKLQTLLPPLHFGGMARGRFFLPLNTKPPSGHPYTALLVLVSAQIQRCS